MNHDSKYVVMRYDRMLLRLLLLILSPAAALGQWEKIPARLELNRHSAQYGFLNGRIYMFGGFCTENVGSVAFRRDVLTLDVADPVTWTTMAPMPSIRFSGYAGLWNGRFYIAGGIESFDIPMDARPTQYKFNRTVLEYDPATDTYVEKRPIPTPVVEAAGAVVGSRIYLIGGKIPSDQPEGGAIESRMVQVYDMATDTWSTTTEAPFHDQYTTAAAIGTTIYYLGQTRDSLEPYAYAGMVVDTGIVWRPIAAHPRRPFAAAAGVMHGKLFMAGGSGLAGAFVRETYYYDDANDSWIETYLMPLQLVFVPVMPSDGNSLYYIGGTQNVRTLRLRLPESGVADERGGGMEEDLRIAAGNLTLHVRGGGCGVGLPLRLFDALGREVMREEAGDWLGGGERIAQLDVSSLAGGVYFLHYNDGGMIKVRRVAIAHQP